MKISFSPPDITEEEINEVADTLRAGWITTGPKTKLLEREVATYCGVNRAVCLSSQTACAETVLRLLEIGPGDEVIVPAYTYTATASIVTHVGATIKMIDCQKNSLEMDYEALENCINEKTKVIIPVDIAGIPCDYDTIFNIVEKKKSLFVPNNRIQEAIGRVVISADTAHSFGAVSNNKKSGSIADFSNFSFHAVKNLTTAEGGAMTWRKINNIDDEEIYKKIQLLSLHGQSKDAFTKTQLGSWEYDVIGPWFKCNMTDISAAIGLVQLKRYPALLSRRREIIMKYDDVLNALGVKTLKHYGSTYASSGHLYICLFDTISEVERNQIITKMAEKGIACNVHYKPLPMMTAYKNLGFNINNFPNAYKHFRGAISLPLHTLLTDEEVEYVLNTLKKILVEYI